MLTVRKCCQRVLSIPAFPAQQEWKTLSTVLHILINSQWLFNVRTAVFPHLLISLLHKKLSQCLYKLELSRLVNSPVNIFYCLSLSLRGCESGGQTFPQPFLPGALAFGLIWVLTSSFNYLGSPRGPGNVSERKGYKRILRQVIKLIKPRAQAWSLNQQESEPCARNEMQGFKVMLNWAGKEGQCGITSFTQSNMGATCCSDDY